MIPFLDFCLVIRNGLPKRLVFIPALVAMLHAQGLQAFENESVTILSTRFNHEFSNDYFSSVTFHSRFLEAFTANERYIAEARIGKNIGDMQVSAAYNVHFNRRDQNGEEHRLYQQFRYVFPGDSSRLDFSARLEERYFTASGKTGARTRLVAYWNKYLSDHDTVRFGNELVLNLNDYAVLAKRGFSQNRLLAGYRHEFPGGTRVDFNYQYRYIHRPLETNFIQHQLQMMLTFDL